MMKHKNDNILPMRQFNNIERYYRIHSKIYDWTRWSFLFGRAALIQRASEFRTRYNILEVGCGTGKNLISLCHNFPEARITGIDISKDMLKAAQKNLGPFADKVSLLLKPYNQPLQPTLSFDLIIFSYCLSMINPGWKQAMKCAHSDLAQGGIVAVVDFNDSPLRFLKYWMHLNHVRMDGHLIPDLKSYFQPRTLEICHAYGGIWNYFIFLGEKK